MDTYEPAAHRQSRAAYAWRVLQSLPWETAIFALIWLNVLAMVLESVAALRLQFGPAFATFERLSIYVFTVEFVVRLWRGRLKFVTSPYAMIDLLAIAPYYLTPISVDLRVLRLARTLRFARLARVAKLGRYSRGLQTLGRVLASRRGELAAAGTLMAMTLLIAASLMYYVEAAAQPESFSSIPAAMWWAVTTLTSVGYGDIYPITITGRIVGSIISILGVAMFAIPAGIVGAGFVDEFQQRKSSREGRCPHCGR